MEALYRKYRPSTFSDVVGQEHIERTLKNAIDQGKVSHAYLFCGPRGTGKTTTARILAKALLCKNGPTTEPDGTCEECQAIAQGIHPDVYELDAASRTGVENVREEIISRVSYAPTRGKWKVYIIDEVHMLSTAAFNALLKTIEEPPGHVAFILCTTDPQKVPETIQSRCQRFDFHRISIESIVSRLGSVCVGEGVEFEPEALELIAHRAEGGMRNALTTLEQLIAFDAGKVTLAGAQNLLGALDDTDLSEIVEAIGRRDAVACFNWLANYVETGADLAQFVQDLAEYVRTMYLLSMAGLEVELQISNAARKAMEGQLPLFGQDRLARMLTVLGDVSRELRTASNPRLVFEIALTRLVRPESDLTLQALAERVEELEHKLAGSAAAPAARQTAAPSVQAGASAGAAVAASSVQAAAPVRSSAPSPSPASGQAQTAAASVATMQTAQSVTQPVQPPASFAPSGSASTPSPVGARPAAGPAAASQPIRGGEASAPASSATVSRPAQQPASPIGAQPANNATPPDVAPASAPSQGAVAMTASIDLSNPAALQRFWRSVTSTLRKVNPARGVLFMNAKVFAEPDGKGIIVQFGKDGGFAYNAAQKSEVQELLAKTIAQVAGGTVPYRLFIEGGAAASASAPAPALRSNPAAAPVSASVAQPNPAAEARPVHSLVPPAAASAPNQPEPHTQSAGALAALAPAAIDPMPENPKEAPVAAPAVRPATAAPNAAIADPASVDLKAASAPAAPAVQYAAPDSDPVPYEEVPLDVYGASVPSGFDDAGYDAVPAQVPVSAPAQVPTAVPAASSNGVSSSARDAFPRSEASVAPARPAGAPDGRPGGAQASVAPAHPVSASGSQPAGAQPFAGPSGQSAAPAQAESGSAVGQGSAADAKSEAEQIKSILTNSFGPGVKFEELPE